MSDSFNLISYIKAVKTFKGIDNQGFESIVFIFREQPKFELKTTKIASRILSLPNEYRLFISLIDTDPTSEEIFNSLTEDLLYSIENAIDEIEVLEILSKRFQYWTELFKRQQERLDEKWVRGFIGELWFLDSELSKNVGVDLAVKSWVGPEKANQDFIIDNKYFEIKTKSQQTNIVKISNDNQLTIGMYLVVVELRRSSEVSNSAVNLSKLIDKITMKINNPNTHIIFNEKLNELGLYPMDLAKLYDNFSYDIQSVSYFLVSNEFPLINHSDVPSAIIKYSYDLSLLAIKDFKISEEEIWK